jgi:hypothetical protein
MARGDRLAVRRRWFGSPVSYLHHGIDMGDGTVVHARPHDFRRPFAGGTVVRTSLEEFADGEPVRTVADPPAAFAAEEVAVRAAAHVGREGYCPAVANCEHFTTWCATGQARSRQVEAAARRIVAVVATTVAVGAAWFGGPAARATVRAVATRQPRS